MYLSCPLVNTRLWVKIISGTVYDGVYHTLLGRFSMLDVATVGIVSVPKRSVLETSRRELSEDVFYDIISTLLVVEQSSVDNHPPGV